MKRASMRWALALLFLAARPGAAVQAPAIEAAREGLVLSRLPHVLAEEEVRKQLGTGLTTSFVFQTTARDASGTRTRGGARVDVRYDLWDEVYVVTRVDASGRALRTTLPSFEKLGEWWRDARLVVIRPPAAGRARSAEVRLRVIPFSQAEQLDAQRWFSQALSAEKSGSAGAVSEAVEDQPESFSQVLNLLMATSIGRPALLEYEWKLIPLSAGNPGKKK
ncbi:MAG TPA: hypothetical protein VHC97_00625 [Thermoanaerobaculia bacterium]|nr:hypothetical protein [Thermoanaerobaculia bacterium]